MTIENERSESKPAEAIQPGKGTEAEQKGGKEPARDKAEQDWQDSAKESGE